MVKDTENAENVCILMSTVGKKLDIPVAQGYLGSYFTLFNKYAKDKSICARHRFMFQVMVWGISGVIRYRIW
jgi:hypothetical protein